MKRPVKILLLAILISACNNSGSEELEIFDNNQTVINPSYKGSFVSDAHPTSGMVEVSQDKKTLLFNNFKTDSGPKLLVYLTTDLTVTDFVNLGDLKGIEGNYSYTIPENTDLTSYKYVIIWCVDFSVSFGHAVLS